MDIATHRQALKVFLVEDHAPLRQRIAGLLIALGGIDIVGEAGSMEEATRGILDSNPDAVLLDLQLTGGSGLSVLKDVHASRPGITFIVLTNHSSEPYRRRAMASGASHFLDKSHDMDRIGPILCSLRVSRCVH